MGVYDATIGTLLVGVFLNTFLYGLVTYQFAVYYRTKFDDGLVTKYMVLFLFILDTFHSIAAIYSLWYYTVANYDNPAVFETNIWPYQFTPISTALVALITEMYLGFRIWRLTHSKLLYGVVIVLAVPAFILGVTYSIKTTTINYLSEFSRITSVVIACLSARLAADTFITVTLIIIFFRWRGGFRKTDTILNRLIRGAIQTGLFSGIFSIGLLTAFVAVPGTLIYVMFGTPIGRIYTNALMDTLLIRDSLRTQIAGTCKVNGTSDPIGRSPAGPPELQPASAAQSVSVQTQAQGTIQETRDPSQREHMQGETVPLSSAV